MHIDASGDRVSSDDHHPHRTFGYPVLWWSWDGAVQLKTDTRETDFPCDDNFDVFHNQLSFCNKFGLPKGGGATEKVKWAGKKAFQQKCDTRLKSPYFFWQWTGLNIQKATDLNIKKVNIIETSALEPGQLAAVAGRSQSSIEVVSPLFVFSLVNMAIWIVSGLCNLSNIWIVWIVTKM